MSSGLQEPPPPKTPNFQPIFEKALNEYRKKTGKDLTAHPLAAQINGCNSPEAILNVLERIASELNQSQSNDERLSKWLNPTVNILSALSATLGQGAGMVSYSAGSLLFCSLTPYLSGIPPCHDRLFWNWYSSRGGSSCSILCMCYENVVSDRWQRTPCRTAMC